MQAPIKTGVLSRRVVVFQKKSFRVTWPNKYSDKFLVGVMILIYVLLVSHILAYPLIFFLYIFLLKKIIILVSMHVSEILQAVLR